MQSLDYGGELLFEKQHARTGTPKNPTEFRRSKANVKREKNGLDQQRREVTGEQLIVIEAEIRNPVSRLYSK